MDIWTETEVMKKVENRYKTMLPIQSVMVKKTSQEEEDSRVSYSAF